METKHTITITDKSDNGGKVSLTQGWGFDEGHYPIVVSILNKTGAVQKIEISDIEAEALSRIFEKYKREMEKFHVGSGEKHRSSSDR